MTATVGGVALIGLEARPVHVECDATGQGLAATRLVGLPDAAVRESLDRVRSAVRRSGRRFPDGKVVVNLAPAGLPKQGAGFDLPVALAVLAASDQLPDGALDGTWAVGELGLDGTARAVPGTLPIASGVRRFGARRLVVPERAAVEAALVRGLEVVPVHDLSEAIAVLSGAEPARTVTVPGPDEPSPSLDLLDVRGQVVGRRALEIAAAGGHHLLFAGPPGCGKSMLARRLPGILPQLSLEEALEVAAIHSVAGARAPDAPLSRTPPLREPHHSTSGAGLVGGGAGVGRPGELSLSHRGVLLLDELLEIPRWILDALRQPLETGEVTIVRARAAVRFPARVLLVAATNPCPCGHLGSPTTACTCRPDRIERYRSRLSGPLLDRIDLQLELRPVTQQALLGPPDGEASAVVAGRVLAARDAASDRWGPGTLVRDAPIAAVRATAEPAALRDLAAAVEGLGLSARGFDRALRVARTIADLDGRQLVTSDHVAEALAYRLPALATVSP